jgi:hypothetical protein
MGGRNDYRELDNVEATMTPETKKVWEELVNAANTGCVMASDKSRNAILAAYRELKERREDEEWLLEKSAAVGTSGKDVYIFFDVDGNEVNFHGPTLHAAILAARGGG